MTVMAHQLPAANELRPLPEPEPFDSNDVLCGIRRLLFSLRMLAALMVAPLLLFVAILGFLAVLADFGLFRLRDLRAGHPGPKGLWEF